MKKSTAQKWFETETDRLRNDPEYQALESLMDLTEKICEMHGQPKGYRKILFWLLQWTAEELIYPKD